MKKILIASLMLSISLSLAACEKNDSSDTKSSKATTTQATTTTTQAADTTTQAADTTSPEISVPVEDASGTLTGSCYVVNYDPEKWADMSATTASTGVDCSFSFIGSSDLMTMSSNFNVVSMNLGAANTLTPADYAEITKTQYDSAEGYECTGGSEVTINGHNAYELSVSLDQSSIVMNMKQLIFIEGENMIVLSYGAEESVFESMSADFQEIIDSFELT